MSKSFLASVIACLTVGLAFFVWLHYAEIRLIDQLLWPQQVEFECVKPEEARARKARCVVLSRKEVGA